MSDSVVLDDFAGSTRRCKVGRILDAMSEQGRSVAEQALAGDNDKFKTARIAEVLSRKVERVSELSVARHRRGSCCCSQ